MPKLWNWTSALTAMTNRRALQALTLAAVAAVSIALPALGSSSASILRAQNGPPPLRSHTHQSIPLNGSLPRILQKAKRTGVESSGRQLNLVVSLQLSDPDGLATLIASQQNAKSPQYHHYLTAQQFIARFAPSAQAVAAVRQFLSSSGLKVTGVSANRTLISAKGSVAQVERVFGVSILQYQLGKRTVYAPDRAPLIPDTLAPYVLNIAGLDDIAVAQPLLSGQMSAQSSANGASNAAKTTKATMPAIGPGGGYTPTELRSAYNVTNLISAGGNGSGQRLAVFELAAYFPNDLAAFRSYYGLPGSGVNNISVDGAAPTCATAGSSCDSGGSIEADLDVEDAAGLSPNATLDVYTGPNSGQGLLDTYNQIVLNDVDAVTTTSWGLCESASGTTMLTSLDQIFAQAASQGQTIAAASGDYGSDDCLHAYGTKSASPNVDSPASDPYVLGVGGTSLSLSSGSYVAENIWNHNGNATGGGISSVFTMPSWQVGAGVTNTYSTGEREVPDVSADADPNNGYSVYCSSAASCAGPSNPWIEVGGTSAAAPLWAGVLTDINTYLVANGVAALGWANPTLYTLFSNSQIYQPFNALFYSGNNDIDFSGTPYAGDYPGTACYSMTMGIGSPIAWNIARDVQSGVQIGGGGNCPNPTPTSTQLITNGGFESGATGWTQYSSGNYIAIIGNRGLPHTGSQLAWECNYPNCDDRIAQTITIPATIKQAELSFWVYTNSVLQANLPNPPCVDHLYVTLATADGTVVSGGQVLNECVGFDIYGYQFEQLDVTSLLQGHTGQQLILMLRGTTTNESSFRQMYTSWYIDDVSLNVK